MKTIGVSNFTSNHIKEFLDHGIVPAINQIEISPMYMDKKAVSICQENGIVITAYAPLGTYDERIMKNTNVLQIAAKYGKQPY